MNRQLQPGVKLRPGVQLRQIPIVNNPRGRSIPTPQKEYYPNSFVASNPKINQTHQVFESNFGGKVTVV